MAAEGGGAAGLDRSERSMLHSGEAVRTVIRRAVRAHDVRQLKPWERRDCRAPWGHGAHHSSRREDRWRAVEQLESRGLGRQRRVREMPVPGRGLDRLMPKQPLDRVHVDARLEQMGREGTPSHRCCCNKASRWST